MELLLLNKAILCYATEIVFTFQYGATSTTWKNDSIIVTETFTFQYGATST